MRKIRHILNRWWFPEVPAERLALLRISTALYALWYVGTRLDLLSRVAETDHSLYAPVGPIQWLTTPLDPNLFQTIVWATLALNLCFLVGIFHRITGPLFAIALFFVLCYRNSWTMIYHSHNLLVLHILVLGFTHAADSFSIDRLIRGKKQQPAPMPSERYGWPISLICMATMLGYFVAGVAKVLSEAGWGWADGGIIRSQVGVDALRKEVMGESTGVLAPFLFEHIWIFTVMGVATLLVELGAPLFMAHRRLAQIWCLATYGMHWGIYLTMGIKFRYQLSGAMFLSFFSLEKIPAALTKHLPGQNSPPGKSASD